jgi:hypothetical protein
MTSTSGPACAAHIMPAAPAPMINVLNFICRHMAQARADIKRCTLRHAAFGESLLGKKKCQVGFL